MTLEVLKGTFYGFFKTLSGGDAIKCIDYAKVLYYHLKDFGVHFINNTDVAFTHLSLAVHKGPVAAY